MDLKLRIMTIDLAVNRDPEILSGELCFRGTRVPVRNLFDHLESGQTLADFFDGFPRVQPEQVSVVLQTSYEGLLHEVDQLKAA